MILTSALDAGQGILRLLPAWVPRLLQVAGGRLRLDPRDLYALGTHRGAIDERWLSSTTTAQNGPDTAPHEGQSFYEFEGRRELLSDAIEHLGEPWAVLCKLFDNAVPIAHHMHQSDAQAALLGRHGKPEAYYFPPQYNRIEHAFPYTFFGLDPATRRSDVVDCLRLWHQGDNGILNFSRAYRLQPATGWIIDPGILHAPGTYVTYEPQRNSDVGAFFQSVVWGRPMPWSALVKDILPEYQDDLDYIVAQLDWESNVDPNFRERRFRPPVVCTQDDAHTENWIVYGTPNFSAKELTIAPGQGVRVRDTVAYGALVVQGHGAFGPLAVEAPGNIRYGQMTHDELFVSSRAAQAGIAIENQGIEDLVILKHFAPGNPDAPGATL